jgi:L-fucose isomerase-like protein
VDALRAARVECLLLDVFHWSRLALARQLVEEVNLPTAVYANTGEGWNGVPSATAICGSLREAPRSRHAALAEAFLDTAGDAEILRWIAGASALIRMRRARVMLWGGSYGAEMPYTRSDPAALEAGLLAEVMAEQEEVLVAAARAIQDRDAARIGGFLRWLEAHGTRIRYDGRMLTPASLSFQVALYLAARDRLAALSGEEIAGAAIKCHYELSIACQGCTSCLLPAFLPFPQDADGRQAVVPFACEGDLNGLVGLVLLHALNPAVPPLFGDLVACGKDHVLLRNCGASSVYWAGRSSDPVRSLARVRLEPNLHGKSGAAVHYETPGCDAVGADGVTFLRVFREGGRFAALLGEGRVLAEDPGSRYADPWPHTRLGFRSRPSLLLRAVPCNHGSLTEGRLASEVEVFCAHAGIPVYRCDDDEGLRVLLGDRRARRVGRGAEERGR